MKICAYCTTENRDAAIFCTRCRRPLISTGTSGASSSRPLLGWTLMLVLLVGLASYLYLSRQFPKSTVIEPQVPVSKRMPTIEPGATRTLEPIVLSACAQDRTRIRRGPGTQYETIGGMLSHICLTILGRNEAASWVYIVSDDHQTGWVDASILNIAGDISRVSVRDDSWAANSGRPTLTSAEIAYGAQAYLTEVSATNLPQAPGTQYVIPCFETADRIGEHISCKMERAVCDYFPDVEGTPTICSDRPYPDHNFALIVFGEDWSYYDGQCLIVSGYLEIDRGVLKIQASQRSQVSFCY